MAGSPLSIVRGGKSTSRSVAYWLSSSTTYRPTTTAACNIDVISFGRGAHAHAQPDHRVCTAAATHEVTAAEGIPRTLIR